MGRATSAVALAALAVVAAAACHDPQRIRNMQDRDAGLPPHVASPPEVPDAGPPDAGDPDGGPPDAGPPDAGPPDAGDPTPTPTPDGVPAPLPGVYTDLGPADEDAGIRGLVSFPIRDRGALEERIRAIYDPHSPEFRRYLTPAELIAAHSPPEEDVQVVVDWLRAEGFEVPFIATNRLLVQFRGTVGQFNKTFDAEVHVLDRKAPQGGNPNHHVYGFVEGGITMPRYISERVHAIATLDLLAAPGPLPGEAGPVPDDPPSNIEDGLTPQQVARAYNFEALYDRGFQGQGVRLGVVAGAGFRFKDLEGFWRSMGISREPPKVVVTMEPLATRYRETTLDLEWAGAMAPRAELIAYLGPDARNTSMLYTFNEAIGRGEVTVITDSFCHREDSEPKATEEAYGNAALMAPALGIFVAAASGDSAGTDIPATAPSVTAVGGTNLVMDGMTVVSETAWEHSGSGASQTFRRPWWQDDFVTDSKRGVVDVSLNSQTPYWTTYLGGHRPNYGTSYASPIFAAMIAVIDSAREANGAPRTGFFNQTLYTTPAVQEAFKDITEGATWRYETRRGWDYPTGFGAPDAEKLLEAIP